MITEKAYQVKSSAQAMTATIANGTALSTVLDLRGVTSITVLMDAAWTTANLSFAVCDTAGGTFLPLYDDSGTEIVVTAAAGRAIALKDSLTALLGCHYVQIRSGVVATPVNQEAARTLKLTTKS